LVPIAVKVTEVPVQILLPDGAIETLTGRIGLTIMVTVLEEAGPELHDALEVSTTSITSLLASVVEVKTGLSVPSLTPLTFHWYEGNVPPLVGVAVKVTLVPEQIVVAEAIMDTPTNRVELTVTSADPDCA
jgi:hypothetical protein